MVATQRKKIGGSLALFLMLSLLGAADAHARDWVAVIKTREAEPYELALKSLRRSLKEKGLDTRIEEFLLPEKFQPAESRFDPGYFSGSDTRLAEINNKKPQLIVTLGSAATEKALNAIKDTPLLFCMVLNPQASGFVRSMQTSGSNLTGASLDIPPQVQFQALRSIVPQAKKIGVIYNPQETETVVEKAKKAAREMGLGLVAVPIASADKVPDALRALDGEIDALWSVADSTTFNAGSMEFIFLQTLRHKLPFMGLSPAFVKAGALLALAVDYQEVGAQCGALAARILAGENPSTLPITTPQKTILHVNLKTAGNLGLTIPAERLKGAVLVK